MHLLCFILQIHFSFSEDARAFFAFGAAHFSSFVGLSFSPRFAGHVAGEKICHSRPIIRNAEI